MNQKWEIDKTFSFCYGHRVWAQELNTEFTEKGHTCPKCRHLHGHEGMVQVFLTGSELDSRGMVEDFVNLGWVKNFLDDNLDHKFILDVNDPHALSILSADSIMCAEGEGEVKLTTLSGKNLPINTVTVPGIPSTIVGKTFDVSALSGPEKEFYEGFFLVDFIPTSENLCKWLFDAVDAKMSTIGVTVSKISWNETPKSRAVYSRNGA